MVNKGMTILAIILISIILYSVNFNSTPGQYDDFAECISDNGAIMYGTDWCPHCKNQKALFGKSFKKVNYVNCDLEKQRCLEAGVTGYPTWIIAEHPYIGTQQLSTLSDATSCQL
ncbi:MAG: hypothetical protein GOV01_00685 [Candidatus Altiarchaeota archaeon]|nr:hypothetical protein [Candidatus Altiarchaeota archaeon]